MSIELIIYFIGVIANLDKLFQIFGVACIIIVALATFAKFADTEEFIWSRWQTWFVSVGVMCFCLLTLIPSEKTMYMMAAAHFGKEAIASDMGQKVEKIISNKLDTFIDNTADKAQKATDKVEEKASK